MEAIDIITVMAIILFARLAIRLVINYKKFKNEDQDNKEQ